MAWQDKYLSPLIEREGVTLQRICKIVKNFFIIVFHALSFHKAAKEPSHDLPDITDDSDFAYDLCYNLYTESKDRIEKVEEKAFKLLSYISALFAILSFVLLKSSSLLINILLITSLFPLLLSMFVSFRCLNVKSLKTVFIPDLYDFKVDPPTSNFERKKISKSFLSAAIFNQNVADNTVDMLKAARNLLIMGLLICILPLILGVAVSLNSKKLDIQKSEELIILTKIENRLDETKNALQSIKDEIGKPNKNKISIIDKIFIRLNELDQKYKELSSSIDRLQNPQNSKSKTLKKRGKVP